MQLNLVEALEALCTLDDPADSPQLTVEIDGIEWGPAEPDVGIMAPYPDDWNEYYSIGDGVHRKLNSAKDFAEALVEYPNQPYGNDAFSIEREVKRCINKAIEEVEYE